MDCDLPWQLGAPALPIAIILMANACLILVRIAIGVYIGLDIRVFA